SRTPLRSTTGRSL
ncbi:hypothetical protein AB1N83_013645, partial [Pleurotus pulmonarius]